MTYSKASTDLVQSTLEETLFRSDCQSDIIRILFEKTEHYDELKQAGQKEGIDQPNLEWVTSQDPLLVECLLSLFSQRAGENADRWDLEEFQNHWQNYAKSLDCYEDLVNSIMLRNDYVLGDRYQVRGENQPVPVPDPSRLTDLQDRYDFITKDLGQEEAYHTAVSKKAEEIRSYLTSRKK